MRTSRIARETAKLITREPHQNRSTRSRTRSFATALQTFTATESPFQATGTPGRKSLSDDESSLSSISSAAVPDIEDFAVPDFPTAKRKREPIGSSANLISAPTRPTIRARSRKSILYTEDEPVGKTKKARRQPAKGFLNEAGEVEIHPPANWRETYEAVKEMRKTILAPVDTMGCETLAEKHISPRDKRFQTLIALMLSSQTKDTTNAIAMRRLQTELPAPGLTLETILDVDPVRLNELIYVVGFHNNKTRYIKATALILRDRFAGDIPDTIEGLTSLPGVGPKMAYLCLSAAWGRTEGIGVDVHVHRITNLWVWHKTKTPEETRLALQAWLPREKWHEINHLLVGFGQTICLPVGRDCRVCTLSDKGLCPSAVTSRPKTIKRVKKEDVVETIGNQINHIASEHLVVKEEDVMQGIKKQEDHIKSEEVLIVKEEEMPTIIKGK